MKIKGKTKCQRPDIYDELPIARQKLVEPFLIRDKQYIAGWEQIIYDRKDFEEGSQEIYTELQELSVELQPVVPLFNEKTLMVYNTKLEGYEAQIYGIDLPNVCWAE